MKASSIWCRLGAVLLIALTVPQADALSPLETCQIVQNGTFIGDPANCQGWYYCLNGQPIGGTCKTGYLYNSYTGSCDYANNVVCSQTTTNMCQGLNAQFVRDPNNCQGYCYCSGGVANCTTCPSGQYFDLSGPQCTWTQGNCVSGSPCLLAQNGFIKNPNSCAGWYRCVSGQIVGSGYCLNNLYFNAFTGMCDYPANVGCNVVTTPAPTDAPTLDPNTCDKKGFLPDPNSCNGYFYCNQVSDNEYTPVWGKCPSGSQFSLIEGVGKCINSYNVNPPCLQNRCAGVSNTYMAVPNTNCEKYVICQNGYNTTTQYVCDEKYPYFNEQLGACQANPPTLPICTVKNS